MQVDRCVCQGITFTQLIREQAETGESLEDLIVRTGCADRCGLCKPYLEIALRDGQPAIPLDRVQQPMI